MGWPSAALGEVAEIERDSIAPESIRSGTRYVGLEHIASSGHLLFPPEVNAGELASSKFAFTREHLLYGKLRPYLSKIARPDFPGVCSTDILPIRPGPSLDRNFLHHYLRLPNMVELANSRAAGANLPRLSPGVLASFAVPLPPLPEQRRIAEVLDRAETLRAQRRQALAQLDALAEAIFLDMFGQFPPSQSKPLAELCELITDGTHYTPTYAASGVTFLSARNVTSGSINWDDIKFIPQSLHIELHRRVAPQLGDLLLAKNGTTGVAAVVDRDLTFDIYVSLALLRPRSGVLSAYLHSALNSDLCRRQFSAALKGIGVPNLHLKDIRTARIPAPPTELQAKFVGRVDAINALKQSHRASLSHLNTLFTSLQHRAFRGEL